jgi:hypothetical protein
VEGVRVGPNGNHPALEFSWIFIKHAVAYIENELSESNISCVWKELRTSVVGGFLPHVLLGLGAIISQFHPCNPSLRQHTYVFAFLMYLCHRDVIGPFRST